MCASCICTYVTVAAHVCLEFCEILLVFYVLFGFGFRGGGWLEDLASISSRWYLIFSDNEWKCLSVCAIHLSIIHFHSVSIKKNTKMLKSAIKFSLLITKQIWFLLLFHHCIYLVLLVLWIEKTISINRKFCWLFQIALYQNKILVREFYRQWWSLQYLLNIKANSIALFLCRLSDEQQWCVSWNQRVTAHWFTGFKTLANSFQFETLDFY